MTSVIMMLMIMMSLRILASCSVHCRLVEESDVYNDVGGLMEVSDVCDDDVDDNDNGRLVEKSDVYNGDTGDNADHGLMEVSDVCDDDVDDNDVTENPG